MSTINYDDIFEKVPSWTSPAEREELARLAARVPVDGKIVEIGALYGGMTIVMAHSNRNANITVVDNFSWSPIKTRPASAAELTRNLEAFDVFAEIMEGDSRVIGKAWYAPIDLLWIDGGHSYEFVRADLENFGPHANVIALHDWENPAWPDIRQAVEDFTQKHPEWEVDHNVEMVVVLKRSHDRSS